VSLRLHVGTYARNGGAGLYPLSRSPAGQWLVGAPYGEAQNASFGTYSARHDVYYFVDEQAHGALSALRDTPAGWQQAARVPTGGAEPCYAALNDDHSLLAVANYGSGSIALYRLDATGLPLEPPAVRVNNGSGPHPERQDGPHAHCVCFSGDQRWLYVADLGTDEVLAYALDPADGSIGEPTTAFAAPAGSGPRHLVFHPSLPQALLVSELASSLTQLRIADGRLLAEQTVSTLPADFGGESLAGQMSHNALGDRVYVTNRGHDSIGVFAWRADGALELLQHIWSGGASPRAFVLLEDESLLLLANEEDGNLTSFSIKPDGTLSPSNAEIALPGAAFLLVAQA
jgi:6-phosphogluconolactonase